LERSLGSTVTVVSVRSPALMRASPPMRVSMATMGPGVSKVGMVSPPGGRVRESGSVSVL
jgi:hypothetical protein